MLNKEEFEKVVKNTPLISIDLIVENPDGKILLGYRNNRPAKDTWFVPGGRILKDEYYEEAIERISGEELGKEFAIMDMKFLGVYEHIYPGDNVFGADAYSTHYIVNAYWIKLNKDLVELPSEQHKDYWWAAIGDLLEKEDVHINTKNYFNGYKPLQERF